MNLRLTIPDLKDNLVMYTDASKVATSICLFREKDGKLELVAVNCSVAEPKLFIFYSGSFLALPFSIISAPAPAPVLHCYLKNGKFWVEQHKKLKNYTTKVISSKVYLSDG